MDFKCNCWNIRRRLGTSIVADGFVVYSNRTMTIKYTASAKDQAPPQSTAPMTSITQGSSLVIRGTVTDTAAGTKQDEQAARFPHGVPAVSDEA